MVAGLKHIVLVLLCKCECVCVCVCVCVILSSLFSLPGVHLGDGCVEFLHELQTHLLPLSYTTHQTQPHWRLEQR